MLAPYRFKKHPIQRAQSFVNYLFLEVILKAPKIQGTFSSALVQPPQYRALIDDIEPRYMLNPLTVIYAKCRSLPPKHIKTLKRAVLNNNRVRELCQGKFSPVLYTDLEAIDQTMSDTIKFFCVNLYDCVMKRAVFYRTFGDIKEYYNKLVSRQHTCRFCGIDTIQNKFEPGRSPFDHYLAKSLYPFTSLNFHNLAPICEKCNSQQYKGSKNILFNEDKHPNERVKAFYPFRHNTPDIHFSFKFNNPYNINYTPDDFDMTIRCDEAQQEADTWNRIYKIETRYKAYCCSDDMLAIIENQFIAMTNEGQTLPPDQYIAILRTIPNIDLNFVKIPFLEEVKGIFQHIDK